MVTQEGVFVCFLEKVLVSLLILLVNMYSIFRYNKYKPARSLLLYYIIEVCILYHMKQQVLLVVVLVVVVILRSCLI